MTNEFRNRAGLCLGQVAAVLLAGTAAATPYDGLYRTSLDADCSRVGVEGGALRIEDGLFEGIGSECRMLLPVDVVDMDATLYTMECRSGDTSWSERAMLMKAADEEGLIFLLNGYAFHYALCPAAGAEPEPELAAEAAPPRVTLPLITPPPRVALPWITLPPEVTLPRVTLPPEVALPWIVLPGPGGAEGAAPARPGPVVSPPEAAPADAEARGGESASAAAAAD